MDKSDFINGERIRCFPVPTIRKEENNYFYGFEDGESFDFKNGTRIDTTTIYYKYSKNLMILDYDRAKPIAHIIINGRIYGTFDFNDIDKVLFDSIDEFIDIAGTHLNISEQEELNKIHEERMNIKEQICYIFESSRLKFKYLTEISNDMKKLDLAMGNVDILQFINMDNFKKVSSSVSNIRLFKNNSMDEFIKNAQTLNNARVYYKLSQVIDENLYNLYKKASKDHRDSLRVGHESAKNIYNNFDLKWKVLKDDKLIKKLGCYLECLNEMYWNDKYSAMDIINLKNEIRNFINTHDYIVEDYLEWLDICNSDKEDIINLINEISFDTNNIQKTDN